MTNIKVLKYLLGKGAFGHVYLGLDQNTHELLAIKTELKTGSRLLEHEKNIIEYSYRTSRNVDIVRNLGFWEDNERYYLATKLLGPNLDVLNRICGGTFSLKTILMLLKQMINILRYYHGQNIVHRDIKPSNFLINFVLPHSTLYLIDFGLSKKVSPVLVRSRAQVGSLRFMSKHVHDFIEGACRDDMYSLGYCIIYLFTGTLPWQTENIDNLSKKVHHNNIGKHKRDISINALVEKCYCSKCQNQTCTFRTMMCDYFNYIDSQSHSAVINYDMLVDAVEKVRESHGITEDNEWDWTKYYR